MSSRLRWSKKVSVEHMRRIRRKRLNGMAFLVWFGWHDVLRRYWCLSVGFVWRSYFLLTILLKNYWKKITARRQQYYFTTSSIYHNNSLIQPKLRHKNLVYILFRCHFHVKQPDFKSSSLLCQRRKKQINKQVLIPTVTAFATCSWSCFLLLRSRT